MYKNREVSSLEKKAKKTQGKTFFSKDIDKDILATIDYEYPQQKITVQLETDEFTCLCPFSGLPDFAHLVITYIPRRKLIELKSLKYYLYAFRNVKVYNEHAVNKIYKDLKKILNPIEISIQATFTTRGGIKNKIFISSHSQ